MANTENIRLWVDALRSGEFTQGRGALQSGGDFCCLGVACEIAIRNGISLDVLVNECPICKEPHPTSSVAYDGELGVLPARVRDWLGVERRDPSVNYEGEPRRLTALNDDGAINFAEIADAIESTFLKDAELVAA